MDDIPLFIFNADRNALAFTLPAEIRNLPIKLNYYIV